MGKKQLNKIRQAYDLTVEEYKNKIDPMDKVPEKFKKTMGFKKLMKDAEKFGGSGQLEDKKFLNPKKGIKFLDAGCCANLFIHRLDKWPSKYYGVDISPALIKAMKNFIKRKKLKIGGLYVANLAKLPFKDNFFDITSCIGVLEYFELPYIKKALKEFHRVLKEDSRLVLDMPNENYPHFKTMIKLEAYLGRSRGEVPSRTEFEKELKKYFAVTRILSSKSRVMNEYFLRTVK